MGNKDTHKQLAQKGGGLGSCKGRRGPQFSFDLRINRFGRFSGYHFNTTDSEPFTNGESLDESEARSAWCYDDTVLGRVNSRKT